MWENKMPKYFFLWEITKLLISDQTMKAAIAFVKFISTDAKPLAEQLGL